MGTTAAKLQAAIDSKEAIRQAIITKDVAVPVETPLSQFPAKIAAIEGGGGDTSNLHIIHIVDPSGVVEEVAVKDGEDAVLPEPKTYDKLVFSRYVGNHTAVTRDDLVAALYLTQDDKTYLEFVVTPSTGLYVQINLVNNGGGTIRAYLGYESGGQEVYLENNTTGTTFVSWTFPAYGVYWVRIEHLLGYGVGLGWGYLSQRLINGSIPFLRKAYVAPNVYINAYAFYGQIFLEHLVLADNWAPSKSPQIPDYAFADCPGIRALIFPSAVINISTFSAWSNMSMMQAVYFSNEVNGGSIFRYSHALKACNSSKLPAAVFQQENMFEQSFLLRYLELPPTTNRIGNASCQSCIRLKDIYGDISSLATVGIYAFNGASRSFNTQSILAILKKITQVDGYFFAGSVVEGVLDIPSNVVQIKDNAFRNWFYLTSITFGANLTLIGSTVFEESIGVKELIFTSISPPSITSSSISKLAKTGLCIYVPNDSVSAYKSATNWASYALRIFPISQRPIQ